MKYLTNPLPQWLQNAYDSTRAALQKYKEGPGIKVVTKAKVLKHQAEALLEEKKMPLYLTVASYIKNALEVTRETGENMIKSTAQKYDSTLYNHRINSMIEDLTQDIKDVENKMRQKAREKGDPAHSANKSMDKYVLGNEKEFDVPSIAGNQPSDIDLENLIKQ